MLPVASKLRIEPESETATREAFPLPIYPELTREPRAMRLMRSQNFSNRDRQLDLVALRLARGEITLRGADRELYRRSQRRVGSGVAKRGRL